MLGREKDCEREEGHGSLLPEEPASVVAHRLPDTPGLDFEAGRRVEPTEGEC